MRLTRKSTQATLFGGEFVPTFPKVRTSRGFLLDWDRNRIVRQILEETRLVETFYGYEGGADEETAKDIARRVEKKIQMLGLQSLSGPLIREIVNMTLLERGLVPPYRNVCTRVGTPRSSMRTSSTSGAGSRRTTTRTSRRTPRHPTRRRRTRSARSSTSCNSPPGPCGPPPPRRSPHPRPGILWYSPVLYRREHGCAPPADGEPHQEYSP